MSLPYRRRPPQKLQNAVLREFKYLCALCGRPQPHIPHIDGDPSNNVSGNLLPLCPNHHLLDAHDPTSPIPPAKLQLFREFRDPAIFLAQFTPLFDRMQFLLDLNSVQPDLHELQALVGDLLAFVQHLSMGSYYVQRLAPLITWTQPQHDGAGVIERLNREENGGQIYKKKLETITGEAVRLLVECLRFQKWKRVSPYPADA